MQNTPTVKMMQAAASGITEMKSSELEEKKSLITVAKENVDKAEEYAITTARYFLDK